MPFEFVVSFQPSFPLSDSRQLIDNYEKVATPITVVDTVPDIAAFIISQERDSRASIYSLHKFCQNFKSGKLIEAKLPKRLNVACVNIGAEFRANEIHGARRKAEVPPQDSKYGEDARRCACFPFPAQRT